MKEQLYQLITTADIHSIYIVDDAIDNKGVNYSHFIKVLRKAQAEGKLSEIDSKNNTFAFDENEPVLDDYSRPLFQNASPAKRLQYMRQVCEVIPLKEEEDIATNLGFASVLHQFKSEQGCKVSLKSFTPQQWESNHKRIAKRIPNGKRSIVLFDQKLDLAGGKYTHVTGIDLVKELLSSKLKESFLTGILTYTVENESNELTERARLASTNGLESEQLFVLTKKRLEKPSHFVDGIKKLLLNEPCEKIKLAATKVGKSAFDATQKKLLALDTYDFNHTVLQSSKKEGVWAPETLFRIIDIIYKDEIKQHILKGNLITDFNALLEEAAKLSKVEITLDSPPISDRYALRRQELYAESELINGLFKPLENGDIFEITAGKGLNELYILIGQTCDLVIRSEGDTMGRRNATVGHLLKIKSSKKAELMAQLETALASTKEHSRKPKDFNHWKTRDVIEHIQGDPEVVGVVELPRAHIINLDVLDLAMFNKNGIAEINITTPHPITLHAGLAKRFSALLKIYTGVHKKFNEYLTKLGSKKVDTSLANELAGLILPKISLNDKLGEPSLKGDTFSFGIKRVKSLRDPYAKNLLDKYTRYLSRTGDLHDFADE